MMVSEGIEINKFAKIYLILEPKFSDDPLASLKISIKLNLSIFPTL